MGSCRISISIRQQVTHSSIVITRMARSKMNLRKKKALLVITFTRPHKGNRMSVPVLMGV